MGKLDFQTLNLHFLFQYFSPYKMQPSSPYNNYSNYNYYPGYSNNFIPSPFKPVNSVSRGKKQRWGYFFKILKKICDGEKK